MTLWRRYSPGDSGMTEIRRRISTPFSGSRAMPATVAQLGVIPLLVILAAARP